MWCAIRFWPTTSLQLRLSTCEHNVNFHQHKESRQQIKAFLRSDNPVPGVIQSVGTRFHFLKHLHKSTCSSSPNHSSTFTLLKRLAEHLIHRDADMASRVAALIFLGLLCIQLASAEVPKDCCLSVSKNRVPAKFVVSYYIQEAGKGCNLSATVFETKGGRRLCIVHPDGFPWVQKVISIVDSRKPASQ
ncbi:C-C motif chemokine 19 [Oryzias melastigma]|uniref:C-C motif chemokine 19 n=1 Tax=Oryzias melastigma TaxID=30732 RepID=A0A834F114_ORYME|nr:C-C motif chemokine 19 [Oryzias melastigma]